jgi:hypothetical protein
MENDIKAIVEELRAIRQLLERLERNAQSDSDGEFEGSQIA